MNYYTIAMIGLAIVAAAVIFFKKESCCNKLERHISIDPKKTESGCVDDSANISLPDKMNLKDINELLLLGELGEGIVLKRPGSTDDKCYREITLDRNGMILQNTGQALVTASQTTYTMAQLREMAPNGLFTGSVPVDEISFYKNGLASSVKYSSDGIRPHNGFVQLDTSQIPTVSNWAIIAVTMQGAALITGQYHLVQLRKALEKNTQRIESIIDMHEKETIGKLLYFRSRLLEISKREYCNHNDIRDIRDCANDSGIILNGYKLRYNKASEEAEIFYFDGVRTDRAINDYNILLKNQRYLQQVCLLAERVMMEAKFVELAVLGKMGKNDPMIKELYKELETIIQYGYSKQVGERIEEECEHIRKKACKIVEQGYSGLWLWKNLGEQEKLMSSVKETIDEMKKDYETIAISNYGQRDDRQRKDVLLMVDEKTRDIKLYEVA